MSKVTTTGCKGAFHLRHIPDEDVSHSLIVNICSKLLLWGQDSFHLAPQAVTYTTWFQGEFKRSERVDLVSSSDPTQETVTGWKETRKTWIQARPDQI